MIRTVRDQKQRVCDISFGNEPARPCRAKGCLDVCKDHREDHEAIHLAYCALCRCKHYLFDACEKCMSKAPVFHHGEAAHA